MCCMSEGVFPQQCQECMQFFCGVHIKEHASTHRKGSNVVSLYPVFLTLTLYFKKGLDEKVSVDD